MKNQRQWFLNVPWGKLALVSYGHPDGEPVFLVHGRQDSSSVFEPIIEQMSSEFYYVALDMPGNGLSDAFPHVSNVPLRPGDLQYAVVFDYPPKAQEPFIELNKYAQALLYKGERRGGGLKLTRFHFLYAMELALLHLGWDKFIFMGHSMGCEQGLFYNVIYPGQITKMILFDAGPTIMRMQIEDPVEYQRSYYDSYYENYHKENFIRKTYSRPSAIQALKRLRDLNDDQCAHLLRRNFHKLGDWHPIEAWHPNEASLRIVAKKPIIPPSLNVARIASWPLPEAQTSNVAQSPSVVRAAEAQIPAVDGVNEAQIPAVDDANEAQSQPAANANEAQIQPAESANEAQIQPAGIANEARIQPPGIANDAQIPFVESPNEAQKLNVENAMDVENLDDLQTPMGSPNRVLTPILFDYCPYDDNNPAEHSSDDDNTPTAGCSANAPLYAAPESSNDEECALQGGTDEAISSNLGSSSEELGSIEQLDGENSSGTQSPMQQDEPTCRAICGHTCGHGLTGQFPCCVGTQNENQSENANETQSLDETQALDESQALDETQPRDESPPLDEAQSLDETQPPLDNSRAGRLCAMIQHMRETDDVGYLSWDNRLKKLAPQNYGNEYYFQLFKTIPPTLLIAASDGAKHIPPIPKWRQGAKELLDKMATLDNFHRVDVVGSHDVHFTHPEIVAPYVNRYLSWDDRLKNLAPPHYGNEYYFQLFKTIPPTLLIAASDGAKNFPPNPKWRQGAKELLDKMATLDNFHRVDVVGSHDVHFTHPEIVAPYVNRFLKQKVYSKL